MKRRLSRYLKPYMVRPIIIKLFSALVISAVIVLLWDRLINVSDFVDARRYVLPVLSAFFAARAWLAFLRLDRIKLPRLTKRKKRTGIQKGGMLDAIDTDEGAFEELQQEEQDICVLVSSLICGVVLLIISLF